MPKRIIIVGANASGVEAASAARKKDRTAEITLVTQEKTAGYSRCGLPFVIGGQIPNFRDLIVYPQAYFQMLKWARLQVIRPGPETGNEWSPGGWFKYTHQFEAGA